MNLQVTVDGSCTRFKRMQVGFVLRDADTSAVLEAGFQNFSRGTNNIAEYQAVIVGCQRAARYQPDTLTIYTDSQLVVHQLRGDYQVKKPHLRRLHANALSLLRGAKAKLVWHSRESGDGPLADELSKRRSKHENRPSTCPVDQRGCGEAAPAGSCV